MSQIILKRPPLITIMCILMFTGGLLLVLDVFTGAFSKYGVFFSPYMILHVLGIAAAGTGLWNMERWGAIVLLIVLAIHAALLHFAGIPLWYLLYYIPVLSVFTYWKMMS